MYYRFLSTVTLRAPSFVCHLSSAHVVKFTCTTDTGAVLWILGSYQSVFTSTSMAGDTGSLGPYVNTRLDSAEGINYNSTATVDVSSLPSNISNIKIICDDNGDAVGGKSAVLTINGALICMHD